MSQVSLQDISDRIMGLAREKGFGTAIDDINTFEKISLIHGEVSEAMEAYRHKNMDGADGFAEELADVVIRVLHLAGVYGIDLEKEILNKIDKNKGRDWDWKNMNESESGK